MSSKIKLQDTVVGHYTRYIKLLEAETEAAYVAFLKYKNLTLVNKSFKDYSTDAKLTNMENAYKLSDFKYFKSKFIVDVINENHVPWMISSELCMVCMDQCLIKARIIGCHHILCEKCIRQLMYTHRNERVTCPMCRQIVMGYEYYDCDTKKIKLKRLQ